MQNTSLSQSAKTQERLSIGKAAEYLGVSIDTLRRWEKKERVQALRSPGGHRYFKRDDLDNLFGKKYTRAPKSQEPPPPQPQPPQQETAALPPEPLTETVTKPVERKNYVVEEYTPAPLAKNTQERLNKILSQPNKSGITSAQKITIGAAVAFFIIDAILLLLWFSSRTILSPVP